MNITVTFPLRRYSSKRTAKKKIPKKLNFSRTDNGLVTESLFPYSKLIISYHIWPSGNSRTNFIDNSHINTMDVCADSIELVSKSVDDETSLMNTALLWLLRTDAKSQKNFTVNGVHEMVKTALHTVNSNTNGDNAKLAIGYYVNALINELNYMINSNLSEDAVYEKYTHLITSIELDPVTYINKIVTLDFDKFFYLAEIYTRAIDLSVVSRYYARSLIV